MSSENFSSVAVVVVVVAGGESRVDRMGLFVCYPQCQSVYPLVCLFAVFVYKK